MCSMARSSHRGFTLVEMLVVISIIGILMSLLLPGVQSARESGRRMQCQNNLKQMATAFASHESSHGFLPTGGWGYRWTGDPDRGFDRKQPGGWVYNILPYMDQIQLHDSGTMCADTGSVVSKSKKNLAAEVAATLQPQLICPSRRYARTYPFSTSNLGLNYAGSRPDRSTTNASGDSTGSLPLTSVARTDYGVNAGYRYQNDTPGNAPVCLPLGSASDPGGPDSLRTGDNATGRNTATLWPYYRLSGICFQRSEVRSSDIVDGASCTYMVGEKSIDPNNYVTGEAFNDKLHCYVGFSRESVCTTYVNVSNTADENNCVPLWDTPEKDGSYRFGSAHSAGFNMAMCDSSVKLINFTIDPVLHLRLGSRVGNPNTEKDQSGIYKPVNVSDF
jgi:prepilin-type N-terminal cleavage/methylation domain-containing protein